MINATLHHQLQILKEAPEVTKRREWLLYCALCIDAVDAKQLNVEEAAYKICGSSSLAMSQLDKEAKKIVEIACDLELPAAHRRGSGDEWLVLVSTVRKDLEKMTRHKPNGAGSF